MDKIKIVVVNENTLGCIRPQSPGSIEIISASKIKGSRFAIYNDVNGFLLMKSDVVRPAKESDFEDLRVEFTQYANDPDFIISN